MLLSSSRFIRIAPKRTVLELREEGPEVWPANFLSTGSLWPRGDVAVDRTRQSDWHLKSIWAAARASNSASGVWPCTARLAKVRAAELSASCSKLNSGLSAQGIVHARADFLQSELRMISEAKRRGRGRPAGSLQREPANLLKRRFKKAELRLHALPLACVVKC